MKTYTEQGGPEDLGIELKSGHVFRHRQGATVQHSTAIRRRPHPPVLLQAGLHGPRVAHPDGHLRGHDAAAGGAARRLPVWWPST